jgi:hypothetical protein
MIGLVLLSVSLNAAAALVNGLRELRGTLSLAGHEPFTYLQLKTDQGSTYKLSGPVAGELRALTSGYVVRVAGRVGHGTPPLTGALEAYQYKIVSVQTPAGERKPWVGRVAVDGTEVYLVTEDLVVYALQGVAVSELQKLDGAKICAVGKANASWSRSRKLSVDFYNVLAK